MYKIFSDFLHVKEFDDHMWYMFLKSYNNLFEDCTSINMERVIPFIPRSIKY